MLLNFGHCVVLPSLRFFLTQQYRLIHLQGLGQLVGNEDDGDLALEAVDGVGELLGSVRIEVGDGFVEDENSGIA